MKRDQFFFNSKRWNLKWILQWKKIHSIGFKSTYKSQKIRYQYSQSPSNNEKSKNLEYQKNIWKNFYRHFKVICFVCKFIEKWDRERDRKIESYRDKKRIGEIDRDREKKESVIFFW